MVRLPPKPDAEARPMPGAIRSLFAVSLGELARDLRDLVDSGWEEPFRRRAHELAGVLALAFDRQGLPDAAQAARSLANLARLTRAQALPLLPALKQKSEALLGLANRTLAVRRRGRG